LYTTKPAQNLLQASFWSPDILGFILKDFWVPKGSDGCACFPGWENTQRLRAQILSTKNELLDAEQTLLEPAGW